MYQGRCRASHLSYGRVEAWALVQASSSSQKGCAEGKAMDASTRTCDGSQRRRWCYSAARAGPSEA